MVRQAPEDYISLSKTDKPVKGSILIIDSGSISVFQDLLVSSYFVVTHTQAAGELDALLASTNYDLVILNTDLPDTDGIKVLRRLATNVYLPGILICTESASEVDRIVALEIGADDIVDKSYSSREILARVRAILRRCPRDRKPGNDVVISDGRSLPSTGVKFLGWFLDRRRMMIFTPAGLKVDITGVEFVILNALMSDPGVVKGRAELTSLRTDELNEEQLRSIDTSIARIRRKLAQHDTRTIIETVRGQGYRSTPHVAPV